MSKPKRTGKAGKKDKHDRNHTRSSQRDYVLSSGAGGGGGEERLPTESTGHNRGERVVPLCCDRSGSHDRTEFNRPSAFGIRSELWRHSTILCQWALRRVGAFRSGATVMPGTHSISSGSGKTRYERLLPPYRPILKDGLTEMLFITEPEGIEDSELRTQKQAQKRY